MDNENKSVNERWAPGVEPRARGYAQDEPDRRTEQLRSDIDRTRADISETVEAIEDRLRPSNVAARAAESVRESAAGAVRQVTSSARQRFSSSGRYGQTRGNGLVGHLRDNPVPTALAAASLAWLAFARRDDGIRDDPSRAIYGSTVGEPFVRETRISLDADADSDWDDRGASMSGAAGETMDRARHAMARTGSQVRATTSRTQRAAVENPLLAGAFAAVAGLAIGLTLPVTERENELMGDARDALVDRGREKVRDTAERVQDLAKDATRLVTGESGSSQPGSSQPGTSQAGTPQAVNTPPGSSPRGGGYTS